MKILDEQTIQQYIENNPESHHFSILADRLLAKGDVENAEEISRIGLALHNDDAEGYYILSKILLSQNKLTEALKQLQNAIKYQPGFISAHKLLLLYGKENLSLKEIDQSHKIVEVFEKNICKIPEVTLEFINGDTNTEEPFLAVDEIKKPEEVEEEIPLEDNNDEELNNSEIDIDEEPETTNPVEDIIDTSGDYVAEEIKIHPNDEEIDFELDILSEEETIESLPQESEESELIEAIEDEVPETPAIPESDIFSENEALKEELDSDSDEITDEIVTDFEEIDLNSDSSDEEDTLSSEADADQNNEAEDYFSGFELDLEEELQSMLSNESTSADALEYPETTSAMMIETAADNEQFIVEEENDNEISDLSILPVEENDEISEENHDPDQETEEIPEFKSNLKQNNDEETIAVAKEKVNLNIPIPTLTFVEVLKKQKLYDQALEILEILEERSSDKDKIIQQKEEIIRLKVEDNY